MGRAVQGPPYLSLFFLPLEELLVEPARFRLPLESPELSLRPPGDTRSEELVLLMLQEGQAGEKGQSFTAACPEGTRGAGPDYHTAKGHLSQRDPKSSLLR